MTRTGRLLFVITSLDRGGAERQVVDLAVRLRPSRPVAVLSLKVPELYVDELEAADVEVHTLKVRAGRPTPAALLRYGLFVRRWRPEVIHSHMVHANLLARLGRVFAPRVPLVCTIHNVTEGARWREIAYRLTDRLATRTTAVSETAARRYVAVGAVPPGRVSYVPNGFDFSAKLRTDDSVAVRRELGVADEFLWLTAGRLHHQKGYDLLLDAFDRLRRDVPNVRLAIAGDGPEDAALRARLAGLDLGSVVTMLGDRADVPALLAAADGFVLSSRWEGLPVVLLEAAAAQLPIVATDVGGNNEVVVPQLGGVLTDVSATAIAAGMARVVGLPPAARLDVGRALREQARARFDLPGILERWVELYDSLAPTPRDP